MEEQNGSKENWTAEELGEQSSYEGETQMGRRLARGDETVGDPDSRDTAGAVDTKDTSHAREDQDRFKSNSPTS
jgi:hypothetical protein